MPLTQGNITEVQVPMQKKRNPALEALWQQLRQSVNDREPAIIIRKCTRDLQDMKNKKYSTEIANKHKVALLMHRASAHRNLGSPQRALHDASKAADIDPHEYYAHFVIGQCNLKLCKYKASFDAFCRAIKSLLRQMNRGDLSAFAELEQPSQMLSEMASMCVFIIMFYFDEMMRDSMLETFVDAGLHDVLICLMVHSRKDAVLSLMKLLKDTKHTNIAQQCVYVVGRSRMHNAALSDQEDTVIEAVENGYITLPALCKDDKTPLIFLATRQALTADSLKLLKYVISKMYTTPEAIAVQSPESGTTMVHTIFSVVQELYMTWPRVKLVARDLLRYLKELKYVDLLMKDRDGKNVTRYSKYWKHKDLLDICHATWMLKLERELELENQAMEEDLTRRKQLQTVIQYSIQAHSCKATDRYKDGNLSQLLMDLTAMDLIEVIDKSTSDSHTYATDL